MSNITLQQFAHAFDHRTDSQSKQGTSIPRTGIIALTLPSLENPISLPSNAGLLIIDTFCESLSASIIEDRPMPPPFLASS